MVTALSVLRARHLAVLTRCAGALARACAPLLLVALPAAAQQADGSAPLLNRAQATYQTTGGNQHTAHDSVFIYIARGTATGGLTLEPFRGTDATVDDLLDAWLRELERIGRAPKTIRPAVNRIASSVPWAQARRRSRPPATTSSPPTNAASAGRPVPVLPSGEYSSAGIHSCTYCGLRKTPM